jgi:hypothetical protein
LQAYFWGEQTDEMFAKYIITISAKNGRLLFENLKQNFAHLLF